MSTAIIKLVAQKGDQLLVSYDLVPGEFQIGRDPTCPITLDSPEVSRQHALLTVTSDRCVLEDIGGKFGTLIDGRQIAGPVSVQPGQSFSIGKLTVTLHAISAASTPPAAALPDRYDRVRHLAKGGMGEIHLAHDRQLQRHVALKLMTPAVAASASLARRFTQEALVLGRLDHPHIVPIHDLGVDAGGQNYYAMKYVRGTTLKDVLNGLRQGQSNVVNRYPLHQLLRIYQKICDAVSYAHAKGIIHRDLKPANIMLGEYGEVFVMDWGLAKIINQDEELLPQSGQSNEDGTRYGTVMGTPGFMAPEQAEGRLEAINQRTDIYSLGAILYNILTLRAPFAGGGAEVLEKVKTGQITAPTKLANEPNAAVLVHCPERRVPDALAAVAMEALQRDAAKRYPAVEALQRDLAAWQSGYAPSAEHAGRLRQFRLSIRRNGSLAAAASIIVLLGIGLGWQHLRHDKSRREDIARLQRSAPICHKQAGDLIAQGNFPDALATARLAHELDPKSAHTHRLARVHIALLQPAKAKKILESVDVPHPFGAHALKLCNQLIQDFGKATLPLHAMSRVHQWQTHQRLGPDARHTAALMEREKLAVWQRGTATMKQIGLSGRLQRDAFGNLKINLSGTQTRDLKPFTGLPVSSLNLWRTRVDDLRPVVGMPLHELYLAYTAVKDLTPLAGCPLQSLTIAFAPVSDLKPLTGMPLVYLYLSGTQTKSLGPLKEMPLRALHLDRTPVADLKPLAGLPIKELRLDGCVKLRDLSPLSQCTNLEVLVLPREHGDIEFLRNLPKLKRLSYHFDRDSSKMETVDQFFRTRSMAARR
ncbi:protein kinase [Verrucomicrobia bacterium]|nr:protein kinase [Verrucomicrobiota bacterium]MDC0218857.1 protein kinase [Verrucomicrobiota bacterium]